MLNRIYQAFPVDIKNPAGFFAALSIISFHDNLSLTLHLVFMISDKFFRKTRWEMPTNVARDCGRNNINK